MTATQMLPAIGRACMLRMESLSIECTITDVKTAYGRARVQVQPIAGCGTQWVELSRINLLSADESNQGAYLCPNK